MKKSTKLIILTAIFGLAFILTACNFSADNSGKNKKKNTTTETPENTSADDLPYNEDVELETSQIPLTLQAITNGNIIISGRNAFEKMQIQKNDGLIIDATENVFVQAGDKIRFYASGYKYKTDGSNNLRINSTADCYVYGNAMSLVYYTDFAGKTELTENYVLQKLFVNNSHIKNHESLDVVLPATTLSDSCYKMMFYGCTGITRAPELPAPTLTKDCYNHMFFNCNNLNSIKCMAADVSAQNCTTNWLANVAAAGNFTSIQENSIWKVKDVCSGIPKGWTANPPFILPNAKEIPLTLEAIEAGTITLTQIYLFEHFMYSKNDGEKVDVTTDTIQVDVGDKICFFADGPGSIPNPPLIIQCSSDCYIYGNIMSLIDSDDFSSNTQIPMAKSFKNLFYNNTHIKNCSIELVLPATELEDSCYYEMFSGCTNLTIAPELPATTLTESCYYKMFYGCTNLAIAPELPATNLANICYQYMFYNCSSLTVAPALPATTLTESCYYNMFYNCSSLTVAPDLPATNLAKSCYYYMFSGCTNLTTAPELPATTLTESCYYNMFSDCTNLAVAPDLPATNLAKSCYSCMFYGCTNLTTAPAKLPATTLAETCYSFMFYKCNLTTAPELPATTMAKDCYRYMFASCSNLTTAPALPAKTLAYGCYDSMFQLCTSLTIAPELPAENLKKSNASSEPNWYHCYFNMFYNCSKLKYVVCKVNKINGNSSFTDEDLKYFCNSWLSGVADSGLLITEFSARFTGAVTPPPEWVKEKNFPLTIEAIQDGTITVKNTSKFNRMKFYKNYELMSNITPGQVSINVTAGDKIWIIANDLIISNTETMTDNLNIKCSADCYIYGNVMSLSAESNYGDKTTIPGPYYFIGLFEGNDHITIHPEEPLILPATTLKEGCYYKMFKECSGLSTAQNLDLKATTLTKNCYKQMFYKCSSLSAAPELKASTLAESCYQEMFYQCNSLSTAPSLPATKMEKYCYDSMFYNCLNLINGPALPATELAESCYGTMFAYCSKLVNAPALPATTLAQSCYYGMFTGCHELKSAPELPAEYLVYGCYCEMFRSCGKLNYIKCMAVYTANNALTNWTNTIPGNGLTGSGTFVRNRNCAFTWPSNANGIPIGWTVVTQ